MKRLIIFAITLAFGWMLNAQTRFDKKFSSVNEYDAYYLAEMKDGNFFGFTVGGGPTRCNYFVFDKKLKNLERQWIHQQTPRHLGFYIGKDEAVQVFTENASLYKLTYNYDERKVTQTKPEFGPTTNDYDNLKLFTLSGKTLYYLNASSMGNIGTGKAWFSGRKYNIVTESMEAEFNDKDNKHKVSENIDQRIFKLKNGNLLVFVTENKSKASSVSIRPSGFSVYLYDPELNLIKTKNINEELWYECSKGLSLADNNTDESNLYLWARNVESNKMCIYKMAVNGNDITITKNTIKEKEIETTYVIDDINKEGYNDVFKLLVTDMEVDKYQENPGSGYYLDSTYKMGNKTYIDYKVVQNIKGKVKGEIFMCGIFVLNEDGVLTQNLAVDMSFNEEKKKKEENQLDNGIKRLYAFYNNNKIVYAYTQNLKLKGFEIEAEKDIAKLEDIDIKLPEEDKINNPWDSFSIIPLSSKSFVVKALHKKIYKDSGIITYTKCDYTYIKIE